MSARRADCIVVGNGVIGMSIAYELARRAPGTSVLIVGPAQRAGAASVAAGAMLNCFGEVTKYTLLSPAGQAKFQLCKDALDAWPDWRAGLAEASGNGDLGAGAPTGTTVLLNAKSGHLDDENFAALLSAAAKFDEPHEEIDPQDVVGLRPLAEARPLRAVHLPREGAIDAREVLAALERALAELTVGTVDDQVAGVETSGGRVTGVRLADGEVLACDSVVLAAGAFSRSLLDVLPPGSVPPVLCGKGIAVETVRQAHPGFQHVVRTPNRSGSCGLHLVPQGDGVEYIGATNLVYSAPAYVQDVGMSEFLVQVAREQLDQRLFFSDVRRWLVGNRPVAVDGYPLIGRTSVAGLTVVAGTYRDGFHCSPEIARLVVDDLLGGASLAEALPHFTPERRPIESLTVEEAVKEFAFHGVSAAIEAGLRLPSHTDTSLFEGHYQAAARGFYDGLEHPVGLAPEIILAIMSDPDAKTLVTDYLVASHRHYGGLS
ncbi:NAD(P)/FAD-dependent oxidoreductase [Nonomuraea africana]|uniref:NAD(P)/FAD-dependent oxidoreductase n=1 Tax=Nonomuraea africana TaxID=46171 RepID=UPI0033F0FFE9